jgi:hypothetical protein
MAATLFQNSRIVDGDPLKDLSLLPRQGKHRPVMMKAGACIKRARLD